MQVTPPRVSRQSLPRAALQIDAAHLREYPCLLVQAPAGYGKTSLLAQWRLDLISHGSAVAWFAARTQDSEQGLLQGLTLGVRMGTGRPRFGEQWLDRLGSADDALEGVTRLLAELAQLALELVLIIDEADRLPPGSRGLLTYLLRNMPPNLRVVIAARADCELAVEDLLNYGQLLRLGPEELRFSLDEALQLGQKQPGPPLDIDTVARLHALCEGWPLGLQLLLSAVVGGADAGTTLSAVADGKLRERLLDLLLSKLDAGDLRFLEDASVVDHLHPALCNALSECCDASERLQRLSRDTPLLALAEASDWLRLHALARERLRERVRARPGAEQAALHGRAAAWLAAHDMLEAAASQAWEAGDHEQALDLAERSLYEALTRHGHHANALEWLERLPAEELQRRPRLQLTAAWTLALSERHAEAGRLLESLLASPSADAPLRCECALVQSGAAVYADLPDRFAELHDPWDQNPPLSGPLLLQIHANRSAFRQLLAGEPALARLRLQRLPDSRADDAGYVGHWSALIAGMSHLWEGQVAASEAQLRPALTRAEAELGRRSPFACMLAALLAATVWEQGLGSEAQALLANRLDVLERCALPEAVLLGFRTLARAACAEGSEPRALGLLGALDAVGQARALPRLRIASLAEQIRLHARRNRAETCKALLSDLQKLLSDPTLPDRAHSPIWWRGVLMLSALAQGHTALAAQDWRAAVPALTEATDCAQALRLGRFRIEARGLCAYALDRCGERAAQALITETRDLADAMGLRRVFADAHPALGEWVRQLEGHSAVAKPSPLVTPAPASVRSLLTMALTPKEREVLELLARNLSNKEIALAMQVGEATIKWHVKNLFAKLEAGARKQVVARARILGLLPPLE